MTEPIIVATDLSAEADDAIVQAHHWAERENAPLVVCHVLGNLHDIKPTLLEVEVGRERALDVLRRRATEQLSTRVVRLTGRDVLKYELLVEEGSPHATVLTLAESRHARLIVVGGSSKAAYERLLLGSVAEQIVRHASVPVLVARPSPSSGNVMVASDLSAASVNAVEAATQEAARRSANISAFYSLDVARPVLATFEPAVVIDDETLRTLREGARDTLAASLARFDASGDVQVVEGDPRRTIVEAAKNAQCELLVIGTHGRTGLWRIAMGSVASEVARKAPCSVLVVRSN